MIPGHDPGPRPLTVIADSAIRALATLTGSLRCTFRCLFANNAFECIEQLLTVQDVLITRPHSRSEIAAQDHGLRAAAE
jgi:hypothetical protein